MVHKCFVCFGTSLLITLFAAIGYLASIVYGYRTFLRTVSGFRVEEAGGAGLYLIGAVGASVRSRHCRGRVDDAGDGRGDGNRG